MIHQPTQTASISAALSAPFYGSAGQWWLGLAIAAVLLELLRGALPGLLNFLIVLPLTLVFWIMLFRIASEVLSTTAQGKPDEARVTGIDSSDGLAVRHIGLWLLALLTLAAAFVLTGMVGAILVGALLALLLPAFSLLLALRNSLIDALNPAAALRLIELFSLPVYTRLCGLLLGLSLAYLLISAITLQIGMNLGLQNWLLTVYWVWAMLAWFSFAGQMLFDHREQLELAPADEAEVVISEPKYSHDPDLLWQEIQRSGGTEAMHQTLAKAFDQAVLRNEASPDDHAKRFAHGRMHVAALLEAFDQPDQALLRADTLLDDNANFALAQSSAMFSLLDAAIKRRQHALSIKLCRSFLDNFPNSQRRNEARLRVCEGLQSSSGAHRIFAQTWFTELMTETLTPEQRQRLSEIAPHYVSSD